MKIDLEERWLNAKWRSFQDYPIEKQLIFDETQKEKGCCNLWVEMFPSYMIDQRKIKNISLYPEIEGELRIIVWEVKNAPNMDINGSDLFVKVVFDLNGESQSTDTHFNCKKGQGNFNWRIIIPFKINSSTVLSQSIIHFQVYDKDLLSSNDFIFQSVFSIERVMEYFIATRTKKVVLGEDEKGKNRGKFFIYKEQENREKQPKVLVSIEILPKSEALKTKAGLG